LRQSGLKNLTKCSAFVSKHPSSTQWNVLGVMLLSLLILIIVSGFSFWLGRQSAGNSLVEYQATVEAIRTQIVQEYIATLQGVFNSGPSDIDLTVTAVYATNTAVAEFLDATETAAAVATLAPSK
jgi:energy-coupling factor transporter transmembrane protein EcfT